MEKRIIAVWKFKYLRFAVIYWNLDELNTIFNDLSMNDETIKVQSAGCWL